MHKHSMLQYYKESEKNKVVAANLYHEDKRPIYQKRIQLVRSVCVSELCSKKEIMAPTLAFFISLTIQPVLCIPTKMVHHVQYIVLIMLVYFLNLNLGFKEFLSILQENIICYYSITGLQCKKTTSSSTNIYRVRHDDDEFLLDFYGEVSTQDAVLKLAL